MGWWGEVITESCIQDECKQQHQAVERCGEAVSGSLPLCTSCMHSVIEMGNEKRSAKLFILSD